MATAISLLATPAGAAGPAKVLHAFGGNEGTQPNGSVIFDQAGNLYGTTSEGGANGFGTVFKLAPGVNGKWAETTLHDFNRTDGANPEGSLIFDSAGNLYGTPLKAGRAA